MLTCIIISRKNNDFINVWTINTYTRCRSIDIYMEKQTRQASVSIYYLHAEGNTLQIRGLVCLTKYFPWPIFWLLQSFLQASSHVVGVAFLTSFKHWFVTQRLTQVSTLAEFDICAENIIVNKDAIIRKLLIFFKVWAAIAYREKELIKRLNEY